MKSFRQEKKLLALIIAVILSVYPGFTALAADVDEPITVSETEQDAEVFDGEPEEDERDILISDGTGEEAVTDIVEDNSSTEEVFSSEAENVPHIVTVSYEVNDAEAGSVSVESEVIDPLSGGTLSGSVAAAKEGYVFQGWQANGVMISENATLIPDCPDTDTVFTAVFKIKEQTYPAYWKEFELQDGIRVSVNAPEGAFPEGTQCIISEVDPDILLETLKVAADNPELTKEDIVACDFDFYAGDTHGIEPQEKITVVYSGIQVQDTDHISLYHIENLDAPAVQETNVERMNSETGEVEFKSNAFSVYAAVIEHGLETEEMAEEHPENAGEETVPEGEETTDAYESYINLVSDTNAFYGGEIITIYNNVIVSGNQTTLPEGSYTVISLPKDSFQKPKESEISTAFDDFKELKLTETDDAYQIITSYKTLYGGYSGGTPVRISLIPRRTVNLSEHIVTQEFFDKNGKKLTQTSRLPINGKAKIEGLYNNTYSASRLKNQIDSNYVIKEGTEFQFYPGYYTPNSNENDPRDRRVYASIPEGTKVKEGTGWQKEEDTGRYYKDIPRDKWSTSAMTITLDFGGIDMSSFDGEQRVKRFQVDFATQPVVDGVPQTDVGPYTAYSWREFYILKAEPTPTPVVDPGAYSSFSTYSYTKSIDENYQPVDGTKGTSGSTLTYLSYNKELLNTRRIRYSNKNISSYSFYHSKGDEKTRELSINSAKVKVSQYTSPAEIRVMIMGLSAEDTAAMKTMLHGTKAYGITSTGDKILITENVPIVSYDDYSSSHTADGWQNFSGGETYSYILFEYPETLKFVGKTQIDKFYQSVWSDVVADIKGTTYDKLVDYLNKEQSPDISGPYDYDRVEITEKFVVQQGKEATENIKSDDDYTQDTFRMQYEDIKNQNSVRVTNGPQFFVDDTVTTSLSYTQYRYGNFSDASEPKNANLYYLVPDGLEPVEDENMFKSIEVIRGYQDGFNLVVATPKTTKIPESNGSINGSRQNDFNLSFLATHRLEIGTYKIYACMSIDNNKLGVDENGAQYGILQYDTPSGVWADILKNARNRPDNKKKFTNFSSTSFTLHPPLVLSSFKEVKLSSEPDKKYASSIGEKATIGTEIDYRWLLKNNSSKEITSLEIIDVLPFPGDKAIVPNDNGNYVSRNSKFETPLVSVEENSKFDFYYSTDPVKETTEENAGANWTDSVDDMSKVTMIKAVLKKGEKLAVKENCSIITHNYIENNSKIQDGEKAYNSFALTLNGGNSYIEALKTEVKVTYPKRDVLIEKSALKNSDKKLYNAVFALYEEGTGENGTDRLIRENIATNHDGIATIPNLLVGKEYYLVEVQAPEGYVLSDQKIKFTVEEKTEENSEQKIMVTNDVYRTEVSVRKKWLGSEAASVEIKLMNGEKEVASHILNAENNWQYTFTDLEEYDAKGEKIPYTLKEVPVEGYKTVIHGNMTDGFVFTNIQLLSIPITKKWAGPETDKAVIVLKADGAEQDRKELTAESDWKATFKELPKYDAEDGHEIQYTVEEESIPNYNTAITGDAENGFTVTNTITGKVSVGVTKKWIGPGAASAEVKLMNGETEVASQILNAENNWQYTFTDLEEYDAQGEKIVYTLEEVPVDGYATVVEGNMTDGFLVTNTNTETLVIPVTKKWAGPETDKAVIVLKADGAEQDRKELTAESDWKATFKELPKYDAEDGHEIQYTIAEEPVPNYNTVITGDAENGFTVTNTITGKVSVGVTKKWIGPGAASAEVKLMNGETEVASQILNAENNWQYTFTDLEEYDAQGEKIVYTLEEVPVDGYATVVEGNMTDGFLVTNTNTETLVIPVTKKWVGPETEKAVIVLKADGAEQDRKELTAESDWKATFKELPKYDAEDGHEIQYTVEEESIPNYNTAITGDAENGFTVTNTITGKVSIPVRKEWKGTALDSVTIRLYADGKEIQSHTLDKKNGWKYVFKNLERYNNGAEIQYEIKEDRTEGYTTVITGNVQEGFIVTNTEIGAENKRLHNTNGKSTDIRTFASAKPMKPVKTGDNSNIIMYFVLTVISAAVIVLFVCLYRKKSRKKDQK